MNYLYFSSLDFALDEKFQKWVLNPNETDEAFWNRWIEQHPEKQQDIAEAIEMVRMGGLSEDAEANARYLRVWGHLQEHAQTHTPQPTAQQKSNTNYVRIAAAWTGLALLTSALLWFWLQQSAFTEYQTGYGETKEIQLTDGSVVTLNGNSTLRYSEEEWAETHERAVYLEGEAFFKVMKTAERTSFVVKTPGQVDVQVLGTQFNVNSREQHTRVVLNEGKVKLKIAQLEEEGESSEVMMDPGELVEFSESEKKLTKKVVDVEVYTSWRNRELIFKATALTEIVSMLEENYGLEIELDTALADKAFTGTFPSDKLSVLLKAIAEVHAAQVSRQGNKVFINKK